jgi:acyl CoA:acetate/3-ketoacid CoA transferase alpha subunit
MSSFQFEYNQEAVKNLKIEDTSILDRLVDYRHARDVRHKKDHSQRDKRMSLSEAVAEFVQDGDILGYTGFGYVRTSLQSDWEIIRQGKKGLQSIGSPNTCQSYGVTFGNTPYTHASYAGAEMRGYDKYFSDNIKSGRVKILSDWSHGLMGLGFKAAQLGLPGVFAKSGLGSDLVNYNPYLKVMNNPMVKNGDPCVFVPALCPDVTFIHVHAADMYGNARFFGPAVNDLALAGASRKLVITAEEIVSNMDIRWNNKGVQIPFQNVDAVVELPYGAAPGYMPGCYYWARRWWEKLFSMMSEGQEHMDKYVREWILDTKDTRDVLKKLGGVDFMINQKRLAKAAEADNEDSGVNFKYEPWTPNTPPDVFD